MSGAKLLGAAALADKLNLLDNISNFEGDFNKVLLAIEGDAKRFAPVDTGNLRASIDSEVRIEGVQEGDLAGFVGTNVEYAPFQELGTARMEANPFLRPAVEKNKDMIEDELGATIEEVADV
jgi:HK97 gp10 family phage protein